MNVTRTTVKRIATLVTGYCTYKITGQVIANNATPSEKLSDKIALKTTQVAVGGVVAARAEKYIARSIDDIADAIDQIKQTTPKK